jgi:cullin-associated NEDD8-dissociated protein 1
MQKTTLRTIVPLARISTPQQAPAFHAFVAALLSDSAYREFRDYQA